MDAGSSRSHTRSPIILSSRTIQSTSSTFRRSARRTLLRWRGCLRRVLPYSSSEMSYRTIDSVMYPEVRLMSVCITCHHSVSQSSVEDQTIPGSIGTPRKEIPRGCCTPDPHKGTAFPQHLTLPSAIYSNSVLVTWVLVAISSKQSNLSKA